MQSFLSGAFYLAVKAQVEIVPLVIVGTYEILPMKRFHIRPGQIRLLTGRPIPTAGLGLHDLESLSVHVRHTMEDMYYGQASILDPRSTAADATKELSVSRGPNPPSSN